MAGGVACLPRWQRATGGCEPGRVFDSRAWTAVQVQKGENPGQAPTPCLGEFIGKNKNKTENDTWAAEQTKAWQ